MKSKILTNRALRYTFIFVILSILWIFSSDYFVLRLLQDANQITLAQTVKGWIFVGTASILLYVALARGDKLLEKRAETTRDWHVVFDTSPNPIWVIDKETLKFLAVNQAAQLHYGYSRKEFLRMTLNRLYTCAENIAVPALQSPDNQQYFQGQWNHFKSNCETILVEIHSRDLVFENHAARLMVITDITEQARNTASLRTVSEHLMAVFDGSPLGIFTIDKHKIITSWNPAAEHILGWPAQEILQKPVKLSTPELQAEFEQLFEKTLHGIVLHEQQVLHLHKNHHEVLVDYSTAPLRNNRGEVESVLVVFSDITRRKQAEDKIRENEERFRAMFDKHDATMLLINPVNGQIVDANLAAEAFYGYPLEKLRQMKITDINKLPPPKVTNLMSQAVNSEANTFVFPHQLASGEIRIVEIHSSPIKMQDQTILFSIIHDITERRKSEEALRSSEMLLAEAQHIAHLSNWEWDAATQHLSWSDETLEILGISKEEFPPNPLHLISFVHPEDREMIKQILMDGLSTFTTFQIEHRLMQPDGKTLWVQERGEVIRDENNQVIKILGTVLDITERKQSEQNVIQQLERMRSLHEIDTVITSTFDLKTSFDFILGEITLHLNAPAAAVLFVDTETHSFRYAACKGFYKPVTGREIFQLPRTVTEIIATQKFISEEIPEAASTDWPDFYRTENFRSVHATPLRVKGRLCGILEVFHRHPVTPDKDWVEYLETLGGQAALAFDNITLHNTLQRSNMELRFAYDATIEGWARALDLRRHEPEGHTQRMADLTLQFARHAGVAENSLQAIRWGVLLHDIGLVGIPDRLLNKATPLTARERAILQQHPVYARDLLEPISFLKNAIEIPYSHHEKWNGSGYPQGLSGEQIPLSARLFAIVDTWDALTHPRPYRPALTAQQALEHIHAHIGEDFDPQLVPIFEQMQAKIA